MQIITLITALPGAVAQGLIWGIMAIGVYITFRILDIADLTVDGTMCTGGAVCIMMMLSGHNVWISMLAATLAGMLAGLATGIFHTFMGIPAILAGILTQLSLYSVNLKIMGKANQAINVDKYNLLVSLRHIKNASLSKNTIFIVAVMCILLIAILYWFFGTELGCSLRATGCNPNMSRAQGINTNRNKVLGLMISNGLVGLSSALLAQYQGFADVNMGRGSIVIGLAAVIIGEAIFGRIFRNFALRLLAVIFGSNGAGKSTLFNAICGDFLTDSGVIMLDGQDITFMPQHVRAKTIGRLYQDPMRGTAPGMTIEENLALAAGKGGWLSHVSRQEKERFHEELKLLDIGLEKRMTQPVGLLSGGQRQALTLLMATMNPPKLLLLDEHTAALDPGTAEKVLNLTKRIVEEHQLTCLMITHNMQSALDLGNRILMMDSGNIVLDIHEEEKKGLTVEGLLEKFKTGAGKMLDNDRILLSGEK